MDVINRRRSVRKFNDNEVSEDVILKLLRAGFQAPTARNQKSFGFVVVRDRDILDKLSNVSIGAKVLSKAKLAIAVIAYYDNLAAPLMQSQDLAAATENILLEATALNLGSCWIGISPIEDRVIEAGKILNVKENMSVFSLIALGHLTSNDDLYYKDKFDATRIFYDKVE